MSTACSPPTPASCPDARKLDEVSFEEMLELAAAGAGVLMLRSVEFARRFNVPAARTLVVPRRRRHLGQGEHHGRCGRHRGRPRHLRGQVDGAGRARPARGGGGRCSTRSPTPGVNVDMIVQNVSHDGHTDISFTVPRQRCRPGPRRRRGASAAELGPAASTSTTPIAKVSVVGAGMRTHPGIAARMFAVLADAGINIEMISTSPIRVSCVVERRSRRARRCSCSTPRSIRRSIPRRSRMSDPQSQWSAPPGRWAARCSPPWTGATSRSARSG